MKFQILLLKMLLLFSIIGNTTVIAQDNDSDEISTDQPKANKKFVLGLYIGSLMANQYTAGMYDGYGFDQDGNKNSFDNSWMNQKINFQYGYQNQSGQPDQIAEQLNVPPGTWSFGPDNMPRNMRYQPAFTVGLNTRYSVDKMNAIIINVNASKLVVSGNFTIETPQPANSTQMNSNTIQTFSIIGGEQRLVLNFGYQHFFGNEEARFNAFVEGGLTAALAKFSSNTVIINSLTIDLTSYYNNIYNTQPPVRRPIGMGFGAFGGLGINIKTNTKYSAQVVYNPSFERINIGFDPQLKLQNAIGLRFYYNF
jgi:hypothetical protein